MAPVIIEGLNEFAEALDGLSVAADVAAKAIVTEGSLIIADTAKDEFRARPAGSQRVSKNPPWNKNFKSHIGRVYYDGAPPYQAVPPNPTIRSNATRSSIRTRAIKAVSPGVWMSLTGPSTPYSGYVEFGTVHIHTPFPFMGTALKDSEDRLAALAEDKWAEALNSEDD